MASLRLINKLFRKNIPTTKVQFRRFTQNIPKDNLSPYAVCLCLVGGPIAVYSAYKKLFLHKVLALSSDGNPIKSVKLTSRERRFIRFASVEYNNQLYMTPQDFLESVVEAEPRPRMRRKMLNQKEVGIIKKSTPTLEQGSTSLFRDLKHKGIISYTEYLFLLSILTKPQSGFHIAFSMFDRDGNERVDKNEFLVMEKIFSHTWKGRRGISNIDQEVVSPIQDYYVDDEKGLQRKHIVDTTLIVHFFGSEGDNDLNFESFKRFMLHLQTELLEMEFNEFSKGLPTISEIEFAKIMLRYTYLDTDEYDMYLDRLTDRIKDHKGITFDEFRDFCEFLNYLDDFSISLQLYTLLDCPIAKHQFHKAVKVCTGLNLSSHLIDTVFAIFGTDSGLLDCRRFAGIMEDRHHRGFKSYGRNEGWEAFKSCLKQEMSSLS